MSEELDTTITQAAQGPKRVKGDQGEVEQHGLADQVVADRYLSAKRAAGKRHAGLRFLKLKPPGAV